MSVPAVLAPVFVLVLLTFAVLLWTGATRYRAIRAGKVRVPDIVLGQRAWPEPVQQVSNAFQNQLELPVLFYLLVAFALITRKADLPFVVLSWIFVATRLVHAFIHVTTNHLPTRFMAFSAGVVVLSVMWVVFALRVLAAGV